MKKIVALNLFLLLSFVLFAQNRDFPFFDEFENEYENWTTISVAGDDHWHISGDDGIDGSKCARFYVTSNPQQANNDYLISPVFNNSDSNSIAIRFKFLYHSDGLLPEFLYSNQFNGDLSASEWTIIDNSFWKNEWGWNDARIEILDPDTTFVFAIRFQSTLSKSNYILIDNFKIENFESVVMEKTGETDHFEYYTNLMDSSNYHSAITQNLEKQFAKLSSLWNRPGIEDIFEDNKKVRIYYTEKENNKYASEEHPEWKNGFHDVENLEIFISPLKSAAQKNYYLSLQNLVVNEFSQLAIKKKFNRENSNYFPPHFLEGFGLYETGFRPRRDSILKYLNQNPIPNFDFIQDTSGISNTLKRDLIISNIEGQVLCGWSYLAVGPGASSYVTKQWPSYLEFFYKASETERIKLQISTANFDFYVAQSDTNHLSEIVSYFENAYSSYSTNYNYSTKHKFNVVLAPNEPIGMRLMNYDDYFNGGAGCGGDLVVELSPNYNYNEENYYSKYFGYSGMCAHEFFHIYYNHFMWEIPGGFWAEGTADFNGRHVLGLDLPEHSMWKIKELFTSYATKYNVDIDLEHISTNPKQELDIYFLGDTFFEYIYLHHGGYPKIMEFFNKQMDYSVFNTTYDEVDKGYINYLKSLVGLTTSIDDKEKDKLNLWMSGNQIIINNKTETNELNIGVYTITGQKIFQQKLNLLINESHRLKVPNLSYNQYYIVRVQSDLKVYVNKVFSAEQ